MKPHFRLVAILAFRNESYYARTCIEHLIAEGIKCIVIDNKSNDNTLDIYREYYPEHLIGGYKAISNFSVMLQPSGVQLKGLAQDF